MKKNPCIEGFVTSLKEQFRASDKVMDLARLKRHSATIHEVVERATKLEAEHRKLEAEHRKREAELRKLEAEYRKLEAEYRKLEAEHRKREAECGQQEDKFREEIKKVREEYNEVREGLLRQRVGSISQRETQNALQQQVDAQAIQLSELRVRFELFEKELREWKSEDRALQEAEAKTRELQEAVVKAQDELQECKAELNAAKNRKSFLRRAGSSFKRSRTTATDAASTDS